MKIQATCQTCGRKFLLSQIGEGSDAPGRCPFCGAHFAKHYSTVLVDAVRDAENAATYFSHALSGLDSLETGFEIDYDALLSEISAQIGHSATGNVA
jgi:DNA-directed RNA polymerase subunit RPC12/RpoP